MKSLITRIVTPLALLALSTSVVSAQPSGHVREDGSLWAQVETVEQALAFANTQNLIARWNNTIIYAKTGTEQLQLMRESGIFADDFSITFNLPDGTAQTFNCLNSPEVQAFYDSVVSGVRAQRLNQTSNIEVLDFTDAGLRARFKYVVFDGATPAFGGENEILVQKIEGRYQIQSSEIHLLIANTAGL